jgi:hypothetical protein
VVSLRAIVLAAPSGDAKKDILAAASAHVSPACGVSPHKGHCLLWHTPQVAEGWVRSRICLQLGVAQYPSVCPLRSTK